MSGAQILNDPWVWYSHNIPLIKKKKNWFSVLEILEIHQETNKEQETNTVSDTLCFDKQEESNRNEPPTLENRKTTPQQQRTNTNTRTKNEFRKFKENYE